MSSDDQSVAAEAFISRWAIGEGGQERANYGMFLTELCTLIGVDQPDPAAATTGLNAYVFERAVTFREPDGTTGRGRIDLYKRGSFVLEAKQSREKGGRKELADLGQQDFFKPDAAPASRRSAQRGWDVLMLNARRQAEDYAKALPPSEGWPPFLLVCDVGHCVEVYADFSGQGKNYAQFPDRQAFRIFIDDLRKSDIRERLRLIWSAPQALDPAKIAAKATRDVAARLAKVSKHLEERGQDAEAVALFLMRCLFTMFAEDVGLLPKDSFKSVLARCKERPELFERLVGQLWEAMNTGGFAYAIEATVKRFNGYLFKNCTAISLPKEEIGELYEASRANWREVEPAIFGTLLEQALNAEERQRLGAHYTPRPYVERLVLPTIIEPLRDEWEKVKPAAQRENQAGNAKGAIAEVTRFHDKLCDTKVLDPACGTGNFLYVSMELMKRLEGEVLEALVGLGGQESLQLAGRSVDLHNFLGLELNPRAAEITQLVLWIGYLQWHLRIRGAAPREPILDDIRTVTGNFDAVLAYDRKELARDENGKPLRRQDAKGNAAEVWRYVNPRRPQWPQADYIVGNPPFIGGKDIRGRLGDLYAEALWAAHPDINESADFVMYWWDGAADLLTRKGTRLKRFGLVTTNSITQEFSRRVIARHLKGKRPVSLLFAIPDHPWTKATKEAAAVRIAMTVATAGEHEGVLHEVVSEAALDTDEPQIVLSEARGRINADLTVGVDLGEIEPLHANDFLAYRGVQLMGAGFIVTPQEATHLGLGKRPGLERHIRDYRNGRDLTGHPRGVMVIDLFGLTAQEVRQRFPEVYQHVLLNVKSERDRNNRESYRRSWWIFGEPRSELRPAMAGLSRYIATVETSKHRTFQFLDASILPDNKLVAFGLADAFFQAVLSSRIHVMWALRAGGWLGVGNDPVYIKSRVFDPFPFPDPSEALKARLRAKGEELDAHRKRVQAEHPDLTLTQLYNVREHLRDIASWPSSDRGVVVDARPKAGHDGSASSTFLASLQAVRGSAPAPLGEREIDIRDLGLVLILNEIHDEIDALVTDAYGFPGDLSDEDILARLVALNAERAAEEQRGLVRWLRPDYQKARAGVVEEREARREEQVEAELIVLPEKAKKPLFPTAPVEQVAAVLAALRDAGAAIDAVTIAAGFRQGRRIEAKVRQTLVALYRLGQADSQDNGRSFNLAWRRAA